MKLREALILQSPSLALQRAAADEIARQDAFIRELEAQAKVDMQWAELWYFVMDEAPLQFYEIVHEYTPPRWMSGAWKLMKEKRGT